MKLKRRISKLTKAGNRSLNRTAWALFGVRRLRSPPMFVLGHDRCGSTWIASAIARAPGVLYFHEPLNPATSLIGDPAGWNRYLRAGDEDTLYEKVFDKAVQGRHVRLLSTREIALRMVGACRVAIKETGGMMCGEWFADRYGGRVVLIIRHPMPVILSNARTDDQGKGRRWLANLLAQPALREDHLGRHADFAQSHLDSDLLTCLAFAYAVRYRVAWSQAQRNPDWLICKYEELCSDPIVHMRTIFEHLGLPFTPGVERRLYETTISDDHEFYGTHRVSRSMPERWRREADKGLVSTVRAIMDRMEVPIYQNASDW